jgi:hypothetical protein
MQSVQKCATGCTTDERKGPRLNIIEKFDKAGQKLTKGSGASIVSELNQVLSSLLGEPYRANGGTIIDLKGNRTGVLGTILHTNGSRANPLSQVEIDADNVACVIEAFDCLNLERLREAYARIASIKVLKKTGHTPSPGGSQTNGTMGIIMAVGSSVSLETVGLELEKLNEGTPSDAWPDMIAVLSEGVINYGAQFPGDNDLGDLLPPHPGALSQNIPAIYVNIMLIPTATCAFRKMCSYLVPHLMLFCPRAALPNWEQLKSNLPKKGVSLRGYQYNLSGQLVPVPRQYHRDRYFPPMPHLISDREGTPLAAATFLPWQDGGVIMMTGKLPLEGLLIFLIADKGAINIKSERRAERQVSYLLPITQFDFIRWLSRIQAQSNMVVKQAEPEFIISKIADEGTATPFFARIYAGMLKLRDNALENGPQKDAFDKIYDRIIKGLMNSRATTQNLAKLFSEHNSLVAQGVDARLDGKTIRVERNIDIPLSKEAHDFINDSVRILKTDMQELTKLFGVDTGFLFQKAPSFAAGLSKLQQADAVLAAYLASARQWTEKLIGVRNDVEHSGWRLPPVKYTRGATGITVEEPQMSGQPVTKFVEFTFERVCCFVEEITAYCLQHQMPPSLRLDEIAMGNRPSEMPERFRIGLTSVSTPRWNIVHHVNAFNDV